MTSSIEKFVIHMKVVLSTYTSLSTKFSNEQESHKKCFAELPLVSLPGNVREWLTSVFRGRGCLEKQTECDKEEWRDNEFTEINHYFQEQFTLANW